MKFLYGIAAVVVIACGATFLFNDAAEKRAAKERLCGQDFQVGLVGMAKETASGEYRNVIKQCADKGYYYDYQQLLDYCFITHYNCYARSHSHSPSVAVLQTST